MAEENTSLPADEQELDGQSPGQAAGTEASPQDVETEEAFFIPASNFENHLDALYETDPAFRRRLGDWASRKARKEVQAIQQENARLKEENAKREYQARRSQLEAMPEEDRARKLAEDAEAAKVWHATPPTGVDDFRTRMASLVQFARDEKVDLDTATRLVTAAVNRVDRWGTTATADWFQEQIEAEVEKVRGAATSQTALMRAHLPKAGAKSATPPAKAPTEAPPNSNAALTTTRDNGRGSAAGGSGRKYSSAEWRAMSRAERNAIAPTMQDYQRLVAEGVIENSPVPV